MTKQHFVAFAAEIKAMENRAAALDAAKVVIAVAQRFNPNFDGDRFLTACGLDADALDREAV